MDVERMKNFLIRFLYYGLMVAIFYCLLKFVLPFFMPFVLAFMIALLLKTPINRLSKALHAPRAPVAVVLLVLFYVVVGTLLALLGARIVIAVGDLLRSLPAFYSSSIEPALYRIQDWLGGLFARLDPQVLTLLDGVGDSLTKALASAVTGLSSLAMPAMTVVAAGVPTFFVRLLLLIISSFFFVVDYYKVVSFLARLLPPRGREMLFRIKRNGVDTVFKFGRAYAILLSLTFVELAIGFSLLGVRAAILVALATAVVDILPVLGTGTILIPWGIYELISGKIGMGIGLLVLYAIITVVRQSLEPRVVGRQIGLYPLATLLCMFAGAQLFGFWGLFGLPISLVVFIQMRKEDHPEEQTQPAKKAEE